MISNGVFRTPSLINLEILTLECFVAIAYTILYYCTVVSLLYLTCVKDFFEIFIFTILKITERVIWTLKVAGFVQIPENNYEVFSFRGIGTQTDVSVHKEAEQLVSITDRKTSPNQKKFIETEPLAQNSEYKLQLTCPQRNIVPTGNLSVLEEIDEPAILILNNDKPSTIVESSQQQHTSQSPLCRIHLTPCPTNLRAKYAKVTVERISPEERSCLKRKWHKWSSKNNNKPCLKMQPLFSSDSEIFSSDERRPKKARKMDVNNCDQDQKKLMLDEESPEMSSCYKNVMLKLKYKFMRRDSASASYKKF